ncbi:hypothetical protein NDU88_001882 [Pleurodeles waltl]|uniref:Uncharacterized protein n=1 Tax=Pleurodeles waltl TaxID=8319 RepID=A0AAV7LYY3_PLEWA|nr:hypothetical protein NDU88_001882 [Pleurodeles waltl]
MHEKSEASESTSWQMLAQMGLTQSEMTRQGEDEETRILSFPPRRMQEFLPPPVRLYHSADPAHRYERAGMLMAAGQDLWVVVIHRSVGIERPV